MRCWPFVLLCAVTTNLLAQNQGASKQLHGLFASAWDYEMEHRPEQASELGDRRWNDRWTDKSPRGYAQRHQHDEEVLAQLAKIDRQKLNKADQLNFDLFKKRYADRVDQYKYHWYLMDFNQREGPQTSDELGDALRFETIKDYEDWLVRMRAIPEYLDRFTALLRQGIRERMVHPRIIMERIPGQIGEQIVNDPAQSGFYKPFRKFPKQIAASDQQRLQEQAKQAIAQQVVPAYTRLKQFFETEYLPACYGQVGAWQLPQGGELYAYFVRHYTTTSLTPEEVHQIGLREVARINREMDEVMQKTGFRGTRTEFFNFLRTDPQFFYKTPEDLLQAYKALAKTVDPNLVKVFRTLPREPYGVEPIPAAVAPDTTAAYYRPGAADGSRAGTYFVNLYKPEARPKWEMTALSLHESVPGHHLQIARAHELGEMPNFRRFSDYTVFVEGWGLYAESLGDDMGLYSDPYSKFGQLSYEMWRAVRLVVDTGMHVKHWTRDQAIRYFMENCPKHELDITNEIDRYIAWPGQALAYKMGELKIKELRARARHEVGGNFDLKEFHDVLLGSGPLPLDILERQMNEWIVMKQQKAAESGNAVRTNQK